MIVDTSVGVAILNEEPEAETFKRILATTDNIRMSAASVLELAIALRERPGI